MTTTIQREGREDVKYNNGNLTLVQKPQLLANAGMLEEECRFEICTTDFWADA